MPIFFPCGVCKKAVAKNHKAVECNNCKYWVHIKCNKINAQTFNILKNDEAAWYCIDCSKSFFSFSELNEKEFSYNMHGKTKKFLAITKKQNQNDHIFINQLKDIIHQTDINNNSLYYNIDEFNETFKENEFS